MSIKVKTWKGHERRFQVYVYFRWADGSAHVDRKVVDAATAGQARRWGEQRERELREAGKPKPEETKAPVMTVETFAPAYVEGHLRANLCKRSATDTAECILRVHILPFIGKRTLDRVTDDVVADLKARWTKGGYRTPDGKRKINGTTARKTINNRLSVLGSMLKTAVEWKAKSGLFSMPCTVRLLKVDNQRLPEFFDHADYERLVEGARLVDARVYALVLLAGDGGLRCGECIALNLCDIDFKNARMTVRRSVYVSKGIRYEDAVKGLLAKPVPLTHRLLDALKAVRHLRGERLLYDDDGSELTQKIVRGWIVRAQRKAGLPETGLHHILRHSFCSHAAMAGVPARTIQDLARHATLSVTMRYMHLSPSALDDGISMLERSREAGGAVMAKSSTSGQ